MDALSVKAAPVWERWIDCENVCLGPSSTWARAALAAHLEVNAGLRIEKRS
jgi:hypothetical protein